MAQTPIRFLLNGNLHEAAGVDPHVSLLQYLREELRLTGTKEGCAEGDCGACTVVLAEAAAAGAATQDVTMRPINACIRQLPTLDGKAIITVEGLKCASGALHPAQQALADCHGSQCGFCTPGFVMSLLALYKNTPNPTRAQVVEALSGNLCRCTGYRPILDAALAMQGAAGTGNPSAGEAWLRRPAGASADALAQAGEQALAAALKGLARTDDFAYEANGVRFFSPRSIASFSQLYAENPDAWILAGGTDVGLWINKALQSTSTILYTGNVAGLDAIERREGWLAIGAAVPLEQAFAALNGDYPEFAHVWQRFASLPIRSSGTLGGNIANGSPIGDSMPLLMVIGAEVVLRRGDAVRTIPLEELYLDYKKQSRAAGEWVQEVRMPLRQTAGVPLRVAGYKNAKRNEQDISAVCFAIAMSMADGVVADVRIALGGMAGIPKRALKAEGALKGRPWDEAGVRAAVAAIAEEFQPLDDMRATASYRLRIAQNLLWRFFHESQGATGSGDAATIETRVF